MPGVIVEVSNVTKTFNKVKALDDVTLEIRRNTVTGLLGPNGAGKSTLLKVMLGILSRDTGTVALKGRDPLYDPRAREHVGIVFERPELPESLPIRILLEHAAKIHGVSRDRVDEAIAIAGLEGHEHKRFNQLSAGLKQRAAIAHALVSEPDLIIADEPTSNLDPVERARLLDVLRKLADKGVTIVLSSHVVHEVIRVSDTIAVMNEGRVIAYGAPHEVFGGFCKARIRTSDPKRLADELEMLGFKTIIEGLNVVVDLDNAGWRSLLKSLSVVEGVNVYQVDFVDVVLEEVLKGEAPSKPCSSR